MQYLLIDLFMALIFAILVFISLELYMLTLTKQYVIISFLFYRSLFVEKLPRTWFDMVAINAQPFRVLIHLKGVATV